MSIAHFRSSAKFEKHPVGVRPKLTALILPLRSTSTSSPSLFQLAGGKRPEWARCQRVPMRWCRSEKPAKWLRPCSPLRPVTERVRACARIKRAKRELVLADMLISHKATRTTVESVSAAHRPNAFAMPTSCNTGSRRSVGDRLAK